MSDCLFCKMITGDIPVYKIYENEHVLAFLDISPVSKGHTLLIPKVHAENLSAGTQEASLELMRAIYALVPKLMHGLGAAGYNLGMNHGAVAGQEVMHTHLHIMPRYAGEPRLFTKQKVTQEELMRVAEKIRASL